VASDSHKSWTRFRGPAHRDELLNIEEFTNLLDAKVLVEEWRVEYNTYRPHSSLGGRTPAEYAKLLLSQPTLS
jgi:transposase InsO family protein